MSHGVCALVPFRSFSSGKQRLGEAMDDASRAEFVEAMLEDTLSALLACSGISRVVLLSDDKEAAAMARKMGATSIAEAPASQGLNAVVQTAALEFSALYESLLVVHGDLPLLQAAEIEQLLQAHARLDGQRKLTIAPDRHKQGSNCVLCSPVDVMRFNYGPGSLAKHLALAAQHGIQSQVVELPGAGMDIDIPDDVAVLGAHQLLTADRRVAALLA